MKPFLCFALVLISCSPLCGAAEEKPSVPPEVAALTEAIAKSPDNPRLLQQRGEARFRAGQFAESVADFDAVIRLQPAMAPHHWQRGISLYYAGRFADGRRQFESHKAVNPDDVENAAWHFLCTAREQGVEAAKKQLIPVTGDPRVPMAEVQKLFAGQVKPDDVLKAGAGSRQGEFFAQLYLGLYAEATGDEAKTREHIRRAADMAPDHYMGDVARVHQRLLEAKK